jgi:hypothetical protein
MVAGGLALYADVATNFNQLHNASVWITAENRKYENELTSLLDRLGIEEKIYDMAWTTGLYGDHIVKVKAQPGVGIISIEDDDHPINVSRVDYNGVLIGFYQTPEGGGISPEAAPLLPPWEYVHFRLLGAKRKRPMWGDPTFQEYRTVHLMAPDTRQVSSKYGTSLIMDALPIYKRLRLAEDSLLMTRLTRGTIKYIYKLGVDSTSVEAVANMIDEYISLLKRARAIDTSTTTGPYFDSKMDILGSIEDVILPVWGDAKNNLDIQKVGGEADIRWIVDVDELRDQLACALRVPVPLLGGHIKEASGALGSEALTKLDIRFARNARRVQRAVKEGLTRLCQIHLAYMNMDPDPDFFEVNLAETSSAEEQEVRDNLDVGVDIIGKYMDLVDGMGLRIDKVEFFDYLNQKFLKLNDLDLNDYILVGEAAQQALPGEIEGMGGAGMPAGAAGAMEMGDLEGGPEPLGGELGTMPGGGVPPVEGGIGQAGPPPPFESRRHMIELRRTTDTCKRRIIREYIEEVAREKRAKRKARKIHEGPVPRAKRIPNLDYLAPLPHRSRAIRDAITESEWHKNYGDVKMTTRAAIKSVKRRRKKLSEAARAREAYKARLREEAATGGGDVGKSH